MTDRRAGTPVTLGALLAARDRRVARREQVFAAQPGTVVSVSVVMPGPVKDCGLSRHAQSAALSALDDLFAEQGWIAATLWAETPETGPEALISVSAGAEAVKRATIALEDRNPLGRLWDLDVVTPDGAVSRRDLNFGPRRCFVCDRAAHECARSRAHSLDALLAVMEEKIDASLDGTRAPGG
jgi:holo-ACP synthase